jgi:hypothetical protein
MYLRPAKNGSGVAFRFNVVAQASGPPKSGDIPGREGIRMRVLKKVDWMEPSDKVLIK